MSNNALLVKETNNNNEPANQLDQRTPPHNIEAEMALLAAIFANNKIFEKIAERLRAEHFALPAHQKIFAAMEKLMEKNQMVSPITLAQFLQNDAALEEIGGKTYIAELATSLSVLGSAVDYAKLIYDLYLRRELINVAEDMANGAYKFDFEISAQDQIESAEYTLFQLAERGQVEGGFQALTSAVIEAIQSAEVAYKRDSHITGVTTGLKTVDRKLGGMHPSDLVIIAGRPAMGKTALVTKMAFGAAKAFLQEQNEFGEMITKEGARVAFFSLEMSAEQLALRLLSEQVRVGSDRIRRGEIKASDFEKFIEVSHNLSQTPLYIDDTPGLTVPAIRNRARRLKRQKGLDMIVIDYLQLIQPTGKSANENRVQAVSEITRGLKILAKELNVPVIALSQLSRGPEQREDKRPLLADLRESGSIEQDADLVMFVFREEYYLTREEPQPGTEKHIKWQEQMERVHNIAELIVAKNRHGPVGTIKLYFEGEFTTFADLEMDASYE